MFGLTSLGLVHTAISLLAVAAGLIALLRDGRITLRDGLGQTYAVTTALTCLTGFGIFQHGGFGNPHVLGIITLVVLAAAEAAGRFHAFGALSAYVETVGYSATFLFHLIPAVTETTTRLPLGHPLLPGPDAPPLKAATGVLFVLFLIGAALQVRKLRQQRGAAPQVAV